jgi:putative tryptophan/tyrosine transport system substrate-binding protein
MRRREFITLVGGAGLLLAGKVRRSHAQQADRVKRIGMLMGRVESDPDAQRQDAALRRGLAALGWVPGQNLEIEYRWHAGDTGQAQAFAKELINLRLDVLVANTTPSLVAMQKANSTIPIIFIGVADPVGQGFVPSLARPGGNMTGFGLEEPSMGAKWVELIKEIAPSVVRSTILFNPESAPFARMFLPSMEAAARSAALTLRVAPVSNGTDIEHTIAAAGREQAGGLIALPDAFLSGQRDLIVRLATLHQLPAVYTYRSFVASGGLIAYGIDRVEIFRLAASYVDRILKGEKPADLPVQLPTKFELVINLRSARVLGLTVPPSLLARADEVIE